MVSIRIIALIDVNSFECQIYQNENPEYKGKPCVVADKTGRIVSITFEAKQLGVTRDDRVKDLPCRDRWGNPVNIKVFTKRQMFKKPDSSLCRENSHEITEIVSEFCKKRGITVEKVSIDEWFLDLTDWVDRLLKNYGLNCVPRLKGHHSVYLESKIPYTQDTLEQKMCWLAQNCKYYTEEEKLVVGGGVVKKLFNQIFKETQFSCSAGVSTNKLLAKQACKFHKNDDPSTLTILSSYGLKRVSRLIAVCDIWRLGGTLGNDVKMKLPHVETMAELKKVGKSRLRHFFGKENADFLYDRARGICDDDVLQKMIPDTVNSSKANLSITDNEELRIQLEALAKAMVERLREDQKRYYRRPSSLRIQFSVLDRGIRNDDEDTKARCKGRTFDYDKGEHRWIARTCFKIIRKCGFNSDDDNTVICALKLTAKKFISIY